MMKNIESNTKELESEFMTAMKFIKVKESNPDVVSKKFRTSRNLRGAIEKVRLGQVGK
jgi:hypothetical protein